MSNDEFYADFMSPNYSLDFLNSCTRAVLDGAEPGKSYMALVRPTDDRSAPSISPTVTRSENGDTLQVIVVTAAGKQCHAWTWDFLQDHLYMYR